MTTDRAAGFGEPASAVAGWPHDGVYTRTFNLDRSWVESRSPDAENKPVTDRTFMNLRGPQALNDN
jgi:hypothetical protein